MKEGRKEGRTTEKSKKKAGNASAKQQSINKKENVGVQFNISETTGSVRSGLKFRLFRRVATCQREEQSHGIYLEEKFQEHSEKVVGLATSVETRERSSSEQKRKRA